MSRIRDCRLKLKLSQSRFAAMLGVSAETYRTWDSGRRETPESVLAKAQMLVNSHPENRWVSLPELARILGVHERTLRKAARDGRLPVTYGTRLFFGKPMARATPAAGEAFKRTYYRQTTRWNRPAPPPPSPVVPDDHPVRLVRLRRRLRLTQTQLATKIGAAGKAVVYQWETRRRKPSSLFWQKVLDLEAWSLLDTHPTRPSNPQPESDRAVSSGR